MKYLSLLIFIGLSCSGFSQQNDPVLFTIGEKQVLLSEFVYIYKKNNGKDTSFSIASLKDYLNLYTKFKLKVQAARDMQVDTIPALIKELEGYRQQLTTSYLNDKEVTDKLAVEVYERQKKDVLINHILFSLSPNAHGEDTARAYGMAQNAIRILGTGMKWSEAAKMSNDLNSAQINGRLGWFTAMFPDGFYALENAAYALMPGQVYPYPIRTRLGYHVLQLEAERPAYRRMEVAHVFLKKSNRGNPDPIIKSRIDSLYKLINAGNSFEEIARVSSDDKTSAAQGGSIGYIGINQFEPAFEDAAFNLAKDGDISMPVESSIGWHIIKRIRKDDELPYDRAKRKIQVDIQRDERFGLAQKALIEKIKLESGFKEDKVVLNQFITLLDSNYFTYKWKAPENLEDKTLFSIGKTEYGLMDFAEFVKTNTRLRMQGGPNKDINTSIRALLDEFVSHKCLQYEEGKLEEKYPDFKALMREYREGILLFEATKNVVWDRASEDTSGLRAFHLKNKDKYKWDERAMILSVAIDTSDKELALKVQKFARKNEIDKVFSNFDQDKRFISYQRTMVEKKNIDSYKGLSFSKGNMSDLILNNDLRSYSYRKVETIYPAGLKTLDEARGYVIADYQDFLEMKWVDELKSKYKIKLNDEVFNQLVKK